MIIVHVPFLWVDGMALFPFVLVRRPNPGKVLLHHERIHLRQQLELGLVLFYVWYLLEYLFRRFQYPDHHNAYLNISFEREAYTNEKNLSYLHDRRWYAFVNYLREKTVKR